MLIVHGTVITWDAQGRVLQDGALRIQGPRIAAVGQSQALVDAFPDDEQIDAQGMLIMPGMISLHTRFDRMLGRGLLSADVAPGDRWRRIEAQLDYQDIRYSTLLGCLSAIHNGTTTVFAHHTSPGVLRYSLDAVAEAVLQAGVRACLSYGAVERESATEARQGVEENARFARQIADEPLLMAAMGLEDVALLAPETVSAAVGAAAISGIGFHVTMGGNLASERDRRVGRAVGMIRWLRRVGVLGRRTACAHPLELTQDEYDELAESNAWVIANPRANLQRLRGPEPVIEFLEHGVPVCLGSDGAYTDMFCEMQALHLLYGAAADGGALARSWRRGYTPLGLSQEQIVEIGIRNNAAFASRIAGEPLGVLREGALADVILVRYPGPTVVTCENLAEHLLAFLDDGRVDTTIVGGRVLMRRGVLRVLDEAQILARARACAQNLVARV